MAEILVVGGGLGGLACAARLAVQGHRVVLRRPGEPERWPRTHRQGGFAFDVGATGLTLPAVYRDLFLKTARRRSGSALEEHVDLQALDPAVECRWSDGTVALLPGTNPGRVASALGHALGGAAEAQWRALCAQGAQAWAQQRPMAPVAPTQRAGRWRRRHPTPPTTLASLGRQHLSDPRLQTLLGHYAQRCGVRPDDAPPGVVAVPYVEQSFGTWHVAGGIGSLVDALAERCREAGVDVRDETGHVGAHDITPYDGVVVEHEPLGSQPESTVLLALRGHSGRPAPTTLLLPADPEDPTPAVAVHAPDDAGMAPDGHEAWTVRVCSVSSSGPSGADGEATLLEHVLQRLAASGLDIRDRLLWASTPSSPSAERLGPPTASGDQAPHVVGEDRPGSALPYLGLPYPGLDAQQLASKLGRA